MPARMGYIELSTVTLDFKNSRWNLASQHEIMPASKTTAPRMTKEGSTFHMLQDTEYLYTAADWDEIELIDIMPSSVGTSLRIRVKNCDQSRLAQQETCASKKELEQWLRSVKFTFASTVNYVDYQKVKSDGDHVESFLDLNDKFQIDSDEQLRIKFFLSETRISLQDSLWQIMIPPEDLTLVNFDKQVPDPTGIPEEETMAAFYFQMNEKVKIEGRIFNSLPQLFGSIGGLRDFLTQMVFFLIGGI